MYFQGNNIPRIGCCGECFDGSRREIQKGGNHDELHSKFALFVPCIVGNRFTTINQNNAHACFPNICIRTSH